MGIFLDGLVLENGKVICDPRVDSHNTLIETNGLQNAEFVKFEYIPPKELNKINDFNSWRFVLNISPVPYWWNDCIKEQTKKKLWNTISDMMVNNHRKLLKNGTYILLDGAVVDDVSNSRIVYMLGNARVGYLRHKSYVNFMRDTASVWCICDTSFVSRMDDDSCIWSMKDESRVKCMMGKSSVVIMVDNAQVNHKGRFVNYPEE